MSGEEIIEAIKEAILLTRDVEERYQVAAFQEVLRHLLESQRTGTTFVQRKASEIEQQLRAESLGEFLSKIPSRSQVDTALAAGYFLLKYKNTDSFTEKDLESLFAQARYPKGNIHLAIIGNIRKGRMIDSGEQRDNLKVFVISRLGEEYVERELLKPEGVGE